MVFACNHFTALGEEYLISTSKYRLLQQFSFNSNVAKAVSIRILFNRQLKQTANNSSIIDIDVCLVNGLI